MSFLINIIIYFLHLNHCLNPYRFFPLSLLIVVVSGHFLYVKFRRDSLLREKNAFAKTR